MSIYFFETDRDEEPALRLRLTDETLHFSPQPLSSPAQAKDIAQDADVLSVFVHSHLSASIIDELPRLKMIATRSTGFDHINVPAAESRGIAVCNVPTYGENTVAEHTFALILALSRNIHKASARAAAGDFSLAGLRGFDLKGKTIGVIGTGHIGRYVISIAHGFGMRVLAYDPVPDITLSEWLGFAYTADLDDLLRQSDVVTLHAPLTAQSRCLIGPHNIGRIKRGALLINTARGELVDTEALLDALDSGVLRGAGLDVIEGEEVFSEEKQLFLNPDAGADNLRTALRNLALLRRPDLIVTPHIAFDSQEAIERLLNTTAANVQAFRQGIPQNVVHT